jgi:hypothetical protein
MFDRHFEVDDAGYFHFSDADESEDVLDLDNTQVLNFLDVNYEVLPGGHYHDEARDFHEEFEERLDAILEDDLREEELKLLEDVDKLLEGIE